MWYTLFKYLLFRPGVKLLLHPTLQGEQNIPRQGGAVLASNHLDIADTLALPALMRRRLTFPAKKELSSASMGGTGNPAVGLSLRKRVRSASRRLPYFTRKP